MLLLSRFLLFVVLFLAADSRRHPRPTLVEGQYIASYAPCGQQMVMGNYPQMSSDAGLDPYYAGTTSQSGLIVMTMWYNPYRMKVTDLGYWNAGFGPGAHGYMFVAAASLQMPPLYVSPLVPLNAQGYAGYNGSAAQPFMWHIPTAQQFTISATPLWIGMWFNGTANFYYQSKDTMCGIYELDVQPIALYPGYPPLGQDLTCQHELFFILGTSEECPYSSSSSSSSSTSSGCPVCPVC